MSGRLRLNLRPASMSYDELAARYARETCAKAYQLSYMPNLVLVLEGTGITVDPSLFREASRKNSLYLNDLFDRIVWCFDHPESNLRIAEEGPRLNDEDEVLFLIGRTVR